MLDVLGYSFLSTVATCFVLLVGICVWSAFAYMLDHWNEFEDVIKLCGVVLLIYATWFTIFTVAHYKPTLTNNAEVQAEDDTQDTN